MTKWTGRSMAAVWASLVVSPCAWGIAVNSLAPDTHNSAPPGAAGLTVAWNAVGSIPGGASCVYLGDRWVISANHGGFSGFERPGFSTILTQSSTRLIDPVNGQLTDIVLFRLASDPGLPNTPLTTTAPKIGDPIYIMGTGIKRNTNRVYYNVTQNPSPTPWTWTPVGSPGANTFNGWAYGSDRQKLWAQNTMIDFGANPQTGAPTPALEGNVPGLPGNPYVRVMGTAFFDTPVSGQALSGDSGGGAFDAQGNLVGLLGLIDFWPDQPANTVIYGDVTYFYDLTRYLPQINRIIGRPAVVPEPSSAGVLLGAAGLLATRRRR